MLKIDSLVAWRFVRAYPFLVGLVIVVLPAYVVFDMQRESIEIDWILLINVNLISLSLPCLLLTLVGASLVRDRSLDDAPGRRF